MKAGLCLVVVLTLIACDQEVPSESCERGELICVGNDVAICTQDESAFTFFKECSGGGACVDGACVGGGSAEGDEPGEAGAGESAEAEGEAGEGIGEGEGDGEGEASGPGGSGQGEEALNVPPHAAEGGGEGEGDGEVDVEGAGEGQPDEGEGEGEGPPDEGGDEAGDEGVAEGEGEAPAPDCVEDADCAGARHCVEGGCPELLFCFTDLDCDDGRRCTVGACLDTCGLRRPCLGQMVCDEAAGLCREAEGGACEDHVDCEGARVCRAGGCEPPCYEDGDCPGSRQCNFEDHACPEASPCVIAVDCDAGSRCVDFQCLRECGVAQPCPGARVCDLGRQVCLEGDACVGDEDCVGARVCDGALCHDPCDDDAGGVCGGGQVCDRDTGHCIEPDVCVLDADCVGIRVCDPDGDCFEPECVDDGGCDEVCVDRRCADEVPGVCGGDDDCPDGEVCAPLGGCVDPDGCVVDGDCPAGVPVCAAGACAGCVGDEDCAAVALCDDGVCLVAGPCAADADCPGVQVCDDEAICRPAEGCPGDAFDEDLDPPELQHRTYARLVLCDGDEDVYRLTVPEGRGVRIILRHDPNDGDLSLTVTEGGQGFSVIGVSDGPFGLESVDVEARLEPRPVDLFVRGRQGAHVPYSLTVEPLDPDACPADLFEGPLGNDSEDRAYQLRTPGEFSVRLCPGDEDWFAMPLSAGVRLDVLAAVEAPAGPIVATVLDPDGDVFVEIRSPQGQASVAVDVHQSGVWKLGLAAGDDGDRLEVALSLGLRPAPDAEAAACGEVGPLEELREAEPRWPARRFALSCGDPFAPDVVGSIEVEQRSSVVVRARGATAVALRRSCDDPESETRCATGLDPQVSVADLPAGRWFVVAQPFDVAPVEFDVLIAPRCVDDAGCEQDAVCAGGVCVHPCADDEDCRGGQRCDVDAGRCLEPDPCGTHDDCLGLRQCRWDGACFEPNCDVHADCPEDEACIDRLCGPPLGDCLDAADCPGRQVCAPLRACVNTDACDGPEDCPVGLDLCAAGDGRCVQCLSNFTCDAGEACVSDRCRFAGGACEEDADCPGDRRCGAAGDCEPAEECDGDRFDAPADPDGPGGPTTLELRTYTGLVLCDGEVDDYLVDVPEGLGIQAVLRHDAAEGDLSIGFEVLGPPIETLAEADGALGVERVALTAERAPAQLGVVVRGRAGATVGYSLSLSPLPAAVCLPDPLEGLLGNDSMDRVTPVEMGEWPFTICPGDQDWFGVELPAGVRLDLELDGEGVADDLVLALLDPDGVLLAEGVAGGVGLLATAQIQAPGLHRIRVAGQVDGIQTVATLGLSASPADASEELACAHAVEVARGAPIEFPRAPAVTRFAVGCGLGLPGLTADHLATFTLDEPAEVSLRLSNGDLMSLRSDCDDPDSETLCAGADDPIWRDLPLAAGQWWVVVQSLDQQRPRLGLVVD